MRWGNGLVGVGRGGGLGFERLGKGIVRVRNLKALAMGGLVVEAERWDSSLFEMMV